MTIMTEATLLRGIGLAAALAAGVHATADGQASERYRLVEVAGSALPVEVEKEWSCRESVTRGTLTLGADSLWTLRYTKREVCGDRAEVENEDESGYYTMEGGTIRFRDDDDDDRDWELRRDVDLDDLESGTVAADGSLTVQLRDGKTTLLFRR
jgi:hypothetical protein